MLLKIPEERIAVLIGKDGRTKKRIEKATKTSIRIEDNSVEIGGGVEHVLKASEVVKAIGRGFSPSSALTLLKEGYFMDIVVLRSESTNTIRRLFGRIIGRSGKTREKLEFLTSTRISVYGKSVAIIGLYEDVRTAREAVERLLKGQRHGTVYGFLKGKQKELPF
jgi:ribosomal RNA assembly protein